MVRGGEPGYFQKVIQCNVSGCWRLSQPRVRSIANFAVCGFHLRRIAQNMIRPCGNRVKKGSGNDLCWFHLIRVYGDGVAWRSWG